MAAAGWASGHISIAYAVRGGGRGALRARLMTDEALGALRELCDVVNYESRIAGGAARRAGPSSGGDASLEIAQEAGEKASRARGQGCGWREVGRKPREGRGSAWTPLVLRRRLA